MIKHTIVILNYNDADTVVSLVNIIRNYEVFDRIVIVDNASTDDSYKKLERLSDNKIHVILAERNGGYSYGNNLGIFYAIDKFSTEYITVANPDVMFEENAASALIDFLEKNEKCGMVAPKVYKGYNAWKLPKYIEIAMSLFVFPRWLFKSVYKRVYLDGKSNPVRVGVIEGSFFCTRAKLLQDIGGYDERTFLYGEENILSKKIIDAGYENVILPQYEFQHYHSVSIKKAISQKATIFKYKYASYRLYCKDYLKVSEMKLAFLQLLFKVAYLERCIYDSVSNLFKKEKIHI